MIIFNESTILARQIYDSLPCQIISACGFLYDYIVENDVVSYYEKNPQLINAIRAIKDEIIIIATDLDSAGELIALELIGLLNSKEQNNKVLRFTLPFETLLDKQFDISKIDEFCTDEIDISIIKQYLSNKDLNIKNKRIGALKYIINHNINDIDIEEYL